MEERSLLILTPEKNKNPSKTLDSQLNIINSYSKGMKYFKFSLIKYSDFHSALKQVFKMKNSFIVLGKLTEVGLEYLETETKAIRRKKGESATIEDHSSTEIVLDIDDHILPEYDPLDPEIGIKNFLEEQRINCDVTWQITSSQKLNTELARIRLFFSCHKDTSLKNRKAWSQMQPESDGSVYTCSQPIYTAPPKIKDGVDPIKNRTGFIKGKRKTFVIPKLSAEIIEENSKHFRSNDYDFEDYKIPQEVLEGKVYRRYFMPLAFHYANKIDEREAIFYIIEGKARRVKSREFDQQNVYQYIDDAIKQIKIEKIELSEKIEQVKDKSDNKDEPNIPQFPNNLLESFPEPWGMLWNNYKTVPMALEEPLLFPTIISINAFFLRSNFVTEHGRRPNMFFLNLTPSTGNKDVNSKNVIRELDNTLQRNGGKFNMFSGILNSESSITSDTSFLQAFTEDEELFWVNTEATRIFQQIKQSGGNSSVAGLSDKLIEVVDGYEITGKVKAAGKVKTIENPNCQILFYAQPETIERFIDEEMVDSGLFGRSLISIIPKIKLKGSDFSMFSTRKRVKTQITQEFIDFYCDPAWLMDDLEKDKKVLTIHDDAQDLLDDWARKEILPLIENDENLHKLLTRLGNSAEQLYCIILGVCQIWDRYKKREIRTGIDAKCLIPILNYWKETKVYAINNLVNTDLDPLAESIIEVIEEILNNKIKLVTFKHIQILKNYGMVSKSQLFRVIKNRTKLIRKLSNDGDKRSATERISRIIRVFVENGVLFEKTIENVICVGLLK